MPERHHPAPLQNLPNYACQWVSSVRFFFFFSSSSYNDGTRQRRLLNTIYMDFVYNMMFNVPLVEFMYLLFTRMSGENFRSRLRSLLFCLCDVFRTLINSLVCWLLCMTVATLIAGLLFAIYPCRIIDQASSGKLVSMNKLPRHQRYPGVQNDIYAHWKVLMRSTLSEKVLHFCLSNS